MLSLFLGLVFGQSLTANAIFPFGIVKWNQAPEAVRQVLDDSDVVQYGRQSSCATYEIVAYQKTPFGTDTVIYSFYTSDYQIKVDNKFYPRMDGLYQVEMRISDDSGNIENGSDKRFVKSYASALFMKQRIQKNFIETGCDPTDAATGFYSCIEKEMTTWSIYTKIGEQINIRVPIRMDARYTPTKIIFRQSANFPNLDYAKTLCADDEVHTVRIR